MSHRAIVFLASAAAIGCVLAACSSSSSSTTGATGAALGSPCKADTDCVADDRGQVACFIGGGGTGNGTGVGDGGGGGGGDGGGGVTDGGATKTWCAFKCTPDTAAQLCGPPFDGICNPRGYCKLN